MTRFGKLAMFVLVLVACSAPSGTPGPIGSTSGCLSTGGQCVAPDAGSPDTGTASSETDAGELADAGPPADVDAGPTDAPDGGPCAPTPDAVLCQRLGWECGSGDVTDCGETFTLDCGQCFGGGECGRETAHVCWCPPGPDAAGRCAALDENCGIRHHWDTCAHPVDDDCGTCPQGQTCNDEDGRCH